ncbi:sodium:solute symporter family protein [Neobacillus mesonae]|uniref:sodium:solute symporter family protein n=1 Tax=Neobacillus mesonae TaxID=1193713 RepID=UPI002E2179C0|nr:sodium:solute symporter family protein [Neobacillus mesonae]
MAIGLGIVVLLGIFVLISVVSKKQVKTNEDYWLMGRKAKWWMFAGTLSASYVSLATFIGGVGASWAWGPMPYLLFFTSSMTFGWIIAVVLIGLRMRKMGSESISDFYRQRFGDKSASLLTGISVTLAAIIFFYLLVQLQGGGIVISEIFGTPLYVGIAIMVAILAVTLASSGMYSVVLTDTFSMFLFIVVGALLIPGTIIAVGSLDIGIGAVSANGGWSATGSSGLDMPYFIGYALAWLSIIGGSPHLINRSLIVDTPKSVVKGSFVAYIITMSVTLCVFLASSMLTAAIEPGSMSPDAISAFASANVWPKMIGVLLIGGAMAAAFTTANTQTITVAQGFVDVFRFSLKPNMGEKQLRKLTMIVSVLVLVLVGAFAAQQVWLIVIASSLAGVIASLGFFPTLILALYWKRLTVKAVKIMLWASIPIGIFMIATNTLWGWFAPFPTVYSYPIGFGGLVLISLLTKQTEAEKQGYLFMREKGFTKKPQKVEKSDYVTIIAGLSFMAILFFVLNNMLGTL